MLMEKNLHDTYFVLPSRGSGVLLETKGYQALLLIEYQAKALALSEYMNSWNYGHDTSPTYLYFWLLHAIILSVLDV